MKCSWAAVVMMVCVLCHVPAARADAPAQSHAARKSADGVDLPAASAQRNFRTTVPVAAAVLGERPEELGRVYNAKRSAALLAHKTKEDLGCEWFVPGVEGADVAGLGLTDGRVTKVVLFFEVAAPLRLANLHKQIDAHSDSSVKVTFVTLPTENKKQSLRLTFEVDPLEFYLFNHPTDPKIADALRRHEWVEGMTDEQALMVGDGPGKYAATFDPDGPATGDARGAESKVFSDGGAPPDIRIEIEAKNKEDARRQALAKHAHLKDITKISGPENPPHTDTDK
ncbi:MAG: hypothetical protein JWP03_2636 [Phycisphaerales bacterium]|nr:hypothetical protein [Phycisphaerales bacterium]